MNPKPRYSVEI